MPRLNDMTTRHRLFRQTPHPAEVSDFFHVFNSPNILNVAYWYEYFGLVRSVPGDIVECGVGRGRSLLTLLALESLFRTFDGYAPRRIHGLDSFEGFPEPSAKDASPRNPKKGEWSKSPNGQFDYSIANLLKIISLAGIEQTVRDDLVLLKGFFGETARQVSAETVALLHLDGDLYVSVRDPLDALASKIQKGGIIVIDDFLVADPHQDTEAFPGARRAVEEFMAQHNDFELKASLRGTPYLIKVA